MGKLIKKICGGKFLIEKQCIFVVEVKFLIFDS